MTTMSTNTHCQFYRVPFLLPADTFEQDVIAFRSVFDASQQTHRCICANSVVKLHGVEVFHGYPSENGSIEPQHFIQKKTISCDP